MSQLHSSGRAGQAGRITPEMPRDHLVSPSPCAAVPLRTSEVWLWLRTSWEFFLKRVLIPRKRMVWEIYSLPAVSHQPLAHPWQDRTVQSSREVKGKIFTSQGSISLFWLCFSSPHNFSVEPCKFWVYLHNFSQNFLPAPFSQGRGALLTPQERAEG